MVRFDRVNYYIGSHEKVEDAARWYDRAARIVHGDFARLNFPEERWEPTDVEWEFVLAGLAPKRGAKGGRRG